MQKALTFPSSLRTPLAVATPEAHLRQVVLAVDRTMLAGRLCLFVRGASAAVGLGISVDVLQKRPSAVTDAALQNAHVTLLADRGRGGPVVVGGEKGQPAQSSRCRLG